MRPLLSLWEVWAFRDRAAESAFNLPTPKSANLYPGGRMGSFNGGGWPISGN